MTDTEFASNIIKYLGGNKNIVTYTHCATRLRFSIADMKKVSKEKLGDLKGVISIVEVAGQLQVVLGPKVLDVYTELQTLILQEENPKVKKDSSKRKNPFSILLDIVSSIFTPILYVLIGAGIIKGLLAIFTSTHLLSASSGAYQIWNAAGDSLYYFLPMILAITCAKRFKTNVFVAVTIAGALLYPGITSLVESGKSISFLSIPVQLTNFNSSVFPIIFAVLLLAWFERFLKKILPDAIKNFTIPLLSLLIIVPITIMVFGPMGSFLSNGIAQVYMTLYGFNKTIAGGFIGAIAQVLVVFGIHWGLFPIIFANIQEYGYDTILAVFGPSIIAQAGAAFGVMLKTKNKKIKEIASPAALIGFFGISETSIYGINLRFKKPFLMAIIGGGIGGAIVGASGSRAIAVAVASVPSFPVYFGKGFVGFLIGYFGAFVISAVLTYLFGYSDDMIEATEKGPEKTHEKANGSIGRPILTIQAPVDGKVETLNVVNDAVFSSGALGSGLAIVPNGEEIVAPVSGIVTATFDTGHAYGIRTNDGNDLLVHIGVDTVKLKGKYFTPKVKKGDVVLKGDTLAHIDLAGITEAGFDPTIIVVLTNANANTKLSILNNDQVKAKEPLLQFVM